MSAQHTMAFLLFATVAAITPGPSNAMLTVTGALAGMFRGLPCLLGVALGMALMMFIAGVGLASVMLEYPLVLAGLKGCGAGFLLWLSWRTAFAPYSDPQVARKPVGLGGALAFQWLNPKSWIVSVAAAGTYVRPGSAALTQALWIAGSFFAVAVACGFLWLGFGVLMCKILKSPSRQRWFNLTMGILLASSVVFVL
jgi:threonine/homoserine/homoserine lactone efflux protein